jgi:catechol 2,3-dioxygenase-like lactoylglutathione lyase family enzyme
MWAMGARRSGSSDPQTAVYASELADVQRGGRFGAMFEHLDYVYMPSRDVAADVAWFTDVLGARLVFAIEGMGTRVAMIELTEEPPRILLAEHLDGNVPILVYRVDDLGTAMADLEGRGWVRGHTLEIPQGPVCSFLAPGGQRLAIYELSRPGVVDANFVGRRDF